MELLNDSIRAFLAVELSDALRASLAALLDQLRQSDPKVSWVPPQNLHLTLRFLGDVERSTLDTLDEELSQTLREVEGFQLSVQGIGAFPNRRKPAIVWAGFLDPPKQLFTAQALTETTACSIGLEAQARRFTPHITLGRIRDPRQALKIFDDIVHFETFQAGEFSVRAVSLFSSELTAQGAIHRKLKEFALKWTQPST